ncbi:hypothetical protein DFP72DRAFT_1069344 [Ephemerocybe angulata]|uniref:Uncharacterized protein n=1 Tax=Ephemerocybe angulata TaxID=980116 RepID=A0A8H6HUB8_9AGAR|nr:hypothetical protein DFP72DRAFT_1069344 [Tulosesus angulatus]
MYTREALETSGNSIAAARKAGLISTVVCCVFGAEASEPLLLPVAIHPGYEATPRNVDLDVDVYLNPPALERVGLWPVADDGAALQRWPPHASRDMIFTWTIFRSRQVSPAPPRNRLYDTLKVGYLTRAVYGNVVVVKSNRKTGQVQDVLERDLHHIESLLQSYVEDSVWEHAINLHPLLPLKAHQGWE